MSATIELKYNIMEMITQLEDDASVEELYQIVLEFLQERGSIPEAAMKKYEPLYGALDDSEPAEAWIARIHSSRIFNQNP